MGNKRGRPSKGRVIRPFTIDKEIADYLDSLPDGTRSNYVNTCLATDKKFRRSSFYTDWKTRKDKEVQENEFSQLPKTGVQTP